MKPQITPDHIAQAHALYCQLTGQRMGLRFERERAWYELLRAGYTGEDLRQVVGCLQREIRASHRNAGALKLSSLLQLDRFEEDLNISRVRLHKALSPPTAPPAPASELSEEQRAAGRQRALQLLAQLRAKNGL